ncbi:Mu transposase C-terminal domain-containing protein [Paenibacillus sp. V4I7]|uniref:Mu transposase C-terminal domain-containing protein n=1 Tax=Paenibacillus sp. V4I7 TaxID=3042307 RepID=UPI002786A941|nr:Mu transposase C-terminal domain-containing protein [Paenibacillus sp. V4I7]MDQ0897496.1 putative transposase [Paenibacillus sp. V4I7]
MARNKFSSGTQFIMDGIEYVIIRKEKQDLIVELIQYKQRKTYSIYELEVAFYEERLTFRDTGERANKIKMDVEFTDDEKTEIDMKLEVLHPVIKGYFHKIKLDEYLQTLKDEKNIVVSKASFYNWKKLWEQYGDARYLLKRKPGPNQRRTLGEVIESLERIMGEKLYSGEEVRYRDIHREYKGSINNINKMRDEDDKAIIRSVQTIWRIVKEKRDYYRQQKARDGVVAAKLERDGSKPMVERPTRPLERVELDWTPIDLFMVDPKTMDRKKAWLVYAIDVFSGNPLGFYITFDTPDSFAIRQCLLHCFLPKVYLKKLYPDVINEWTAYGIPKELVIDNASSNNSYNIEEICENFGMDLLFPEVAAGHKKGTVERGQKTFNDIVHTLKGTTFSNMFKRKMYDSKGKACITLQAFYYIAHIIFVDIISHNWSHSRIGGTPHQIWERAFAEDPSLIKELPFTKKEIKLALCGGSKKRKIQSEGVTLSETWFWSEELMQLKNKMKQEGDEDLEVLVRFDFADVKKVYVQNPYDYSYIEAEIDPNRINEYEKHYDLEPSLPIPYQQIKTICLSEGRKRREFDDTHIIQAMVNIHSIEQQQDKDKRRGYTQTLQAEASIVEGLALGSFDYGKLGAPEEPETFRYVGQLTEEELRVKKGKDAKDANQAKEVVEEAKKGNESTMVSTAEVNAKPKGKVHNEAQRHQDIDDDLPTYETSRLA